MGRKRKSDDPSTASDVTPTETMSRRRNADTKQATSSGRDFKPCKTKVVDHDILVPIAEAESERKPLLRVRQKRKMTEQPLIEDPLPVPAKKRKPRKADLSKKKESASKYQSSSSSEECGSNSKQSTKFKREDSLLDNANSSNTNSETNQTLSSDIGNSPILKLQCIEKKQRKKAVGEKSGSKNDSDTIVKMKSEVIIESALNNKSFKKGSGKLVGSHCSIAGGLHKAVEEAVSIGARSFGLFLRSQRTWTTKPLDPEAANKFKASCKEHGFAPHSILPHGSYLMNCGSPNPVTLQKSRDALLEELKRCEALGLTLYNFHPGCSWKDIVCLEAKPCISVLCQVLRYTLLLPSRRYIDTAGSTCGEISVEESLDKIAESIDMAHAQTKFVTTVVENMCCQGNTIGGRFEELKGIIERVKDKTRIGVCLDTCHAFAAGFDLSSKEGFEKFVTDFDSIVGFPYLKAIHFNDSKGGLGCHLDRHENIGKGQIGLEGFRRIMQDPRFDSIPMILETPVGDYAAEIKTLNSLE